MLAAALMLLPLLVAGQVDVHSATDCPSARAIAERLDPLLPGTSGRDTAEVRLADLLPDGTAQLEVRLHDAAGVRLGERRLAARGSCAELANAVAIVLAAWKSSPPAVLPPSPLPAPLSAQPRDGAGLPGIAPARRWSLLAGAGAGVQLVGGAALGGSLELRLGRTSSPWQARWGLSSQTARAMALPAASYQGSVDWQHTSAALGVGWRSPSAGPPGWRLELDGGVLAGWATVSGRGYPAVRRERSFEYGVVAGLRAGYAWSRLTLWLEARPSLWLKRHQAQVTGSTAARELPWVDVGVGAGLSWAFLP